MKVAAFLAVRSRLCGPLCEIALAGDSRAQAILTWSLHRYTTANPENLDQDFQGTDFKAPMAGFGALFATRLRWKLLMSELLLRLWTPDRAPLLAIFRGLS
jgi:hypothetical protein